MMQYEKKWFLTAGLPMLAAFLFLTAGCRSDAYYQDQAVQRARTFLLENATDLTAEQLYFVKFNRPVLLTGEILPAPDKIGHRTIDVQQICVSWRFPGSEDNWMVFGASSGNMSYWYPNRLIKKTFEKVALPIEVSTKQARAYSQNYLFEVLNVREFNRVRFHFPYVLETNFPLVLDPTGVLPEEEVEAVRKKLDALTQLTLAWPLDDSEYTLVFCGNGKPDLSGWAINFAGKMKTSELDAATVREIRTPQNAQIPIPMPEEDESLDEEIAVVPEPTVPQTEESATEEPATEEPATEEPATEEPATEEPATEEPNVEEAGE